MKNFQIVLLGVALSFIGCNTGPRAIAYGSQDCTFCKMTIMDKRFGCQVMNNKGKAYDFDDLSCLASYLKTGNYPQEDIAEIYVPDFLGDNALHKVSELQLVVSEAFKSPMSGNVAGFLNADSASEYANRMNGKKVLWSQILADE